MASTGPGIRISMKANADLNAYQWHFVRTGSVVGEVAAATGGSNPGILGVLENDPRTGEEALVCVQGLTKVSASGALSTGAASALGHGAYLVAGSNAKATIAAGSVFNAIALDSVASAGAGIISVYLPGPGVTLIAGTT